MPGSTSTPVDSTDSGNHISFYAFPFSVSKTNMINTYFALHWGVRAGVRIGKSWSLDITAVLFTAQNC